MTNNNWYKDEIAVALLYRISVLLEKFSASRSRFNINSEVFIIFFQKNDCKIILFRLIRFFYLDVKNNKQ